MKSKDPAGSRHKKLHTRLKNTSDDIFQETSEWGPAIF